MDNRINAQTYLELKALLTQMSQQGLTYEQIQHTVAEVMSELSLEAQAAEHRADQILEMIRDSQSQDSTRLKEFLAQLEKNETRH